MSTPTTRVLNAVHRDKGGAIFNIAHKDFGAKADSGVTDNRAAIVAAVTAAKDAGGGTVFIPPAAGFYGVAGAPMAFAGDVYSRITICGGGWASRIKRTTNHDGSGTTPGIFAFAYDATAGYLQDMCFRDFCISGNSGTLDLIQAIHLSGAQRAQFLNVRVENVGYEGVYFNGPNVTNDCLVQGCWATLVGKAANVSAYNLNCTRAVLLGCRAIDVATFVEHTGQDVTISDFIFKKASFQGVLLHSTSSTWTDTVGGTGTQNSERATVGRGIISDSPTGVNIGDPANSRGKILISDIEMHLVRRPIDVGVGGNQSALITDIHLYDSPGATNAAITLGAGRIVVDNITFHKGTTAGWSHLVKATVDDYHIISNLKVYDVPWTTAAIEIAGMKAIVKEPLFQPTGTSMVGVAPLRMIGGAQQMLIGGGGGQDFNHQHPFTFGGQARAEVYAYRVPTSMTWKVGDLAWNANVTPTFLAWLCTVAGTAGTLNAGATTASTTSGTPNIAVNSGTGLYPGAMITIAGVTGIKTIVSGSGTAWVIDSNASATVAGAAVAYSAPTFVAFGHSQGSSADNGDASVTVTVSSAPTQRFDTALTANRTVTLPSNATSANGDRFRITRTGLGAFTLTVQDAAATALKVIPSATAAFVDAEFNGTNWKLAAYGTL